ncbi:isoprenoid biosynthesis glyoxalase ElbB [Chitinimonas lacunae]|uniref:Isoprenoid biosynthesis glyoxalase ElbB n=1 Tax=Chitinimonas lacunae TaxID=1963018 RepID=A0ABV8ML68_9NEIS
MKKIAVVLSGCGVNDGSEITEAVAMLVSLSRAGLAYDCFAPNRSQSDVIDHAKGEPAEEKRNILSESARIARGKITALDQLKADDYAAIAFPGGFGVAKNLTTFAKERENARLHDDVKAAVLPFAKAGKPIVAVCAGPLILGLVARELGIKGAEMTFGEGGDPLSKAVESWGQCPVTRPVEQACVDRQHRFVSAPAYMYGDARPDQIFASVDAAIAALRELLG